MILPKNGKVIVFDDQHKDVEILLKILSKERIPYLYYQDELGTDLPDFPVENVRLVILDLELVSNNLTSHNIIAAIGQRLKRVLTKNTSYILIYWSEKEGKYRSDLENAFNSGLKEYKPIIIKSLSKTEAKVNSNPINFIRESLSDEMKLYNSMNAFLLWESCANNASGTITNSLINIFLDCSDWDKNFCNLLFTLSRAEVGTDIIKSLTDKEKLTTAFEIINSTLIDTIENNFQKELEKITISEIKELEQKIQPEEKIKLNTSINLIKSESLNHYFSGNLYIKPLSDVGKDIIAHNFQLTKLEDINNSTPKLICLDITPSCDYSQRKDYTRILYGVIVSGIFSKSDLKSEDSRYRLCPIMELETSSYLIFDYRHFESFSHVNFEAKFEEKPKYRLRKNILLDIQAQLSNHINRPGFVTI